MPGQSQPGPSDRRDFLKMTAAATAGVLAAPSFAQAATDMKGGPAMAPTNRAKEIFKPQFAFGLGGVPLGNEFNKITDRDAEATLQAAWDAGVRYFDVAPWYGFGLAERRFGQFLHNQRREDYVLSSKVELAPLVGDPLRQRVDAKEHHADRGPPGSPRVRTPDPSPAQGRSGTAPRRRPHPSSGAR